MTKKFLFLSLVLCLSFLLSNVSAVNILTVGTDSVVYKVGENITVSGHIYASTGLPIPGAPLSLQQKSGPSSLSLPPPITSNSDGSYRFNPFTTSTPGNYTIRVIQTNSPGTYVTGSFTVIQKKILYTVSTDKFTYEKNENVTITVLAKYEDGSFAGSVSVPVKIKLENGTLMKEQSVTTNSNGIATLVYTATNYGKYVVVVGNSLAIAKFEVPSFEVKIDTQTPEGKSKYLFSSDESLKVRVIVSIKSGNTYLPVKAAAVSAIIKDSSGVSKLNLPSANFTETSDGVYELRESSYVSLAGYSGRYYVEVEVTKGETQTSKIEFKVQNYRLDVVPFSKFEHTFGFLKNSEANLGLIIQDLKTGAEITEDKVQNASIVECRTEEWKTCTVTGEQLLPGFKDFTKTIRFITPSSTGQYYLKVRARINTTKGLVNVTGDTWISVQEVIASIETKDMFGGWRWRYGPGETVVLKISAFGSGWKDATNNISSIQVEEIRDDDWNDVTSSFSQEIDNSAKEVKLTWNGSQTQPSGWYSVKLKLIVNSKEAYAGVGFRVSLYDIWADVKDENGNWQWKFGPNSDVFLHVNVRKIDGSLLPISKIAKVSVLLMRNEITGKVYTNLRVSDNGTAKNWEGEDIPVKKLSLAGMGLSSGFYSVEIEITDTEGNKERGGTGFKVSNLDVWVSTWRGSEWAWQFAPDDNITLEVHASYFNGTFVPDGSNVTVEKLFLMRDGPPIPISSDKYDTALVQQTSSGVGTTWLKARGGPLPEGYYMVMVRVKANDTTSEPELAEGWFEIRTLRVELSTDQWAFSPGQNVTIHAIVRKTDNTPVANANVSLAGLKDTTTWTDLDLESYGISGISNITDATGKADITFQTAGGSSQLDQGEYEVKVRVSSESLKAKTEGYIWFSLRTYTVSGYLVTEPGREYGVYAPNEEIKMQVEVYYPNGTHATGKDVQVYKLVNTGTWPWSYKDAEMVSSVNISEGVYEIRFKAPRESGWYNPLLNISGILMKSPWDLPQFEVRSLGVSLTLYNSQGDETDEFAPGEDVTVNIRIKNPTGGALPNITEIKLDKYRSLATGSETEIGAKKTSNIEESNNLTFSPSGEGEYVLVVSVKMPTATVYEEKWFRVSSFDVEAWSEKWSYSKGENVSVHVKAFRGSQGIAVNVSTLNITNVWTGEKVPGVNSNQQAIPDTGGTYNVSSTGLSTGEYEAELCVFTGSSCAPTSKRVYVHFSIETFLVDVWPEKGGSFVPSENVTLNVEVWNPDHTSQLTINSISLTKLINTRTGKNFISSVDVSAFKDIGERWKVTFPASSLEEGEYDASLNVTSGTESIVWHAWFKISSFEIILQTVPPVFNPWDSPFPVEKNITFNITVVGNATVTNGTLYIKDNLKNWVDAIPSKSFTLTNKQALVNVSLPDASEYTAVAQVGSAEAFYWFKTRAFEITIEHQWSTHDIKPDDNVNITFDVRNSTGGESGFNVIVNVSLRRSKDWSIVNPSVYNGVINAQNDTKESFVFDPNASGNIEPGEYEAEISFTIVEDGTPITQKEYFWFQVRTLDFWAWPDKPNYLPGDEIIILVNLRWPNATGISGRNITIEKVYSRTKGDLPESYILDKNSSITDSEGKAALKLKLSPDITGWIDVELEENGTYHQRTWAGFNINGYSVTLERDWDKWAFSLKENYTANLTVFFINGTPASGRSVRVEAFKEGKDPEIDKPDLNETMVNTDLNGYSLIQFNCSNLTGGAGRYWIIIRINEKAAKVDDWIKVESFRVDTRVEGQNTTSDEVRPGEVVKVLVKAEEFGTGNPIVGANVSLLKLHKLPEWDVILLPGVGFNVTKENGTTDSTGFVELGFIAPPEESDYVIEVNVSHSGYGNNVGEAWLRVTNAFVEWQFMCWNGTDVITCGNRDPYTRLPGENVTLVVTSEGNSVGVWPFEIKDLWRDTKITLDVPFFGPNPDQTVAFFPAPTDEGDYEVAFYVYLNGNQSVREERAWFKVLSSTGLVADSWVEPVNAWIGRNATVWVNVHNATFWESLECNISESKPIVKIMDGYTWTPISFDTNNQWVGEPQMGPGPMGTPVKFLVPSSATPGKEYAAILNFTCSNLGVPPQKAEAWFRVAAFEASSLMSEVAEPNQTLHYWIKVTDINGTPVQGATICQDELVQEPGWNVIQSWPDCLTNHTTDSKGEVLGNITAPGFSGDFSLHLRIINGSLSQKIDRWFTIRYIKEKIILPKDSFFNDEDVNFNVSVIDGMTNEPIQDAFVDVFIMPDIPPEEGEKTNMEIHLNNTTDASGIAHFTLPKENTTSNNYRIGASVCIEGKGCVFVSKSFTVRFFNTTITGIQKEYTQGDNVTITIHSLNATTGQALAGANVTAVLVKPMFGPGENETNVSTEYHSSLNDTGYLEFNLPISDNHYGITLAMIEINSSGKVDEESYVFITHKSGVEINISMPQIVSTGELVDVNVSVSGAQELAIAPPLPTMEKVGESIPESQMMSMGEEFMSFLESPIFLNSTGQTHMKILAPNRPGKYTTMIMFIEKGSDWFGPESMVEITFNDYEVQ